MKRTPLGIFQDDADGIYYGLQSEFSTRENFIQGIEYVQGDKFPVDEVTEVYARFCVAQCPWHEYSAYDGFWHIEREPGRGRTKAWRMFSDP
ncbi:hypothetical protein LCGC14_1076210 [marine sediment metagenome]|uniref:Uncharacterized protein n=1 Tax=marine sediment metagenome TaxID=412755 RepID=A0A0F9N424_9ZZZZ